MKFIAICVIISSMLLLNRAVVSAQVIATPKTYKLVWTDEFNQDGPPDTTNWKFEKGFVRNNELQWYQPQNAWCSKGLLIIEVRQEHSPNPNFREGSTNWKTSRPFKEYTSASLNTRGLHSWQYGRFEMRAKIDTNAGLWPAFWALGIAGEWPSCGEIDMMEYYQKKILANIACGTDKRYKAKWYSKTKAIAAFADPKWSSKFHIWRMDWDEKAINLYVDNELINHVDQSQLINGDGSGVSPFHQPQYLLLNLALGGDNGGSPSSTQFPRRFEIDYVRVYQ